MMRVWYWLKDQIDIFGLVYFGAAVVLAVWSNLLAFIIWVLLAPGFFGYGIHQGRKLGPHGN